MNLVIRRGLVTAGVLGSLVVGLFTIHAAAAWTASSAPLPPPPMSAEQLQARLADEQARSAALTLELDQLRAQTSQVGAALKAAQGRITTDDATATKLRAQLAAAQAKIASILAAARANGGQAAAPPVSGSGGGSTSPSVTSTPYPDGGVGDN